MTEISRLAPQERIALQMTWESNIFLKSPVVSLFYSLFLALICLQLIRFISICAINAFSTFLCKIAGENGLNHARFKYGEYCIKRADYPIEYGRPWGFVAPFGGTFLSSFKLTAKLYSHLLLYWMNNFLEPRQKKFLASALEAFESVSPDHNDVGKAAYFAGLIYLRGFNKDSNRARKCQEIAATFDMPSAQFELALILLNDHDVNQHIRALELLRKAKAGLAQGNILNRALYEMAKLECRQMGVKNPDLHKAQEYLQVILAGKNMKLLVKVDSDVEAHLVELDEAVADAQLLLIEVTEKIKTEAQLRLTEAEREKREAIENMMAMFAHKFRGPVDSILFNTSHQHDERVYVDAARTMNGLLDIFSVVSTHPDKLLGNLKDDIGGEGSPGGVLLHATKLALVQLLSLRNRRRMSPHYLAYAKKQGKAPEDLRPSAWAQEKSWQEMEKSLQILWEQEVGEMIVTASLDVVNDWMKTHLLPIRVDGFAESNAQFAQYGPKASLLTVIFTEVLVNAVKHAAPSSLEPIELSWCEGGEETVFSCVNPSSRESRTREASKGSGRGHKFLGLIADHLQGRFDADVFRDVSRVSMTLPSSAMMGDAK
jgi:hypothetical protein